ncbi:MAG TPA: ATP-binding protein, partial [Terriglobales bacterium]|jgi:nitrogen fixation/metabolism regulation signal transduction histidine kinase
MLINLVRNAADAALEADQMREDGFTPHVSIRWFSRPADTVLEVIDNGPGLLNPENAFVPFYTTKAGGSGIGLALARQVIEAHSGTIELHNRTDARGCVARVVLPSANQKASATTTRM